MAKDEAGNEIVDDQVVDDKVVDDKVVDDKVVDDKVVDDKVDDTGLNEDQKEAEEKKGIFAKIGDIIKGKKEDDSADGTGDVDIPDEFVTAAKAAGYSEEQITTFAADYSNEELLSQVPYLEQSSAEADESDKSAKKDEVTQDTEKKVDDKASKDDKDADKVKDEVIRKLQERVDKLEASDKKNIDKDAQEVIVQQATRATEAMDKLSEDYEVFGTYEKLPRFPDGKIIPNSPANIARNEVWSTVVSLTKAGTEFETALLTGINAYKGAHLEKDAQRNVIKSLKRNEKKLTPKHTSHEPAGKALTGPELIRATGKKLGLEIR